jgi:hypothetical protein
MNGGVALANHPYTRYNYGPSDGEKNHVGNTRQPRVLS